MSKSQDERKIYGLNAALSFAHRFPERVVRAWLSEDAARLHFGPLMKFMAQEKRAYHIADDLELEKVTQSEHHEGVCLLVTDYPPFTVEALVATLPPGKPVCLLALDGVSNPHNLGAIMRVAAHFGVAGIISEQPQLLRSGSAVRTAEGGATYMKIVATDHLGKTLQFLKKRQFSVLATSSHESRSLYEAPLPERVVLVLGEEQNGVSKKILQLADARIAIGGTGWVESLRMSASPLASCWENSGASTGHRSRWPRRPRPSPVARAVTGRAPPSTAARPGAHANPPPANASASGLGILQAALQRPLQRAQGATGTAPFEALVTRNRLQLQGVAANAQRRTVMDHQQPLCLQGQGGQLPQRLRALPLQVLRRGRAALGLPETFHLLLEGLCQIEGFPHIGQGMTRGRRFRQPVDHARQQCHTGQRRRAPQRPAPTGERCRRRNRKGLGGVLGIIGWQRLRCGR